jgi:hypothetical protein
MNRFKNQILLAASFAVLAGVISGITAAPAIAQAIKAALIKNVDEKGRSPFTLSLSCNANFSCIASGAAVPNGKRLVIEHVSGSLQVDVANSANVQIQNFTVAGRDFAPVKVGTSPDGIDTNWVVNDSVLVYLEPAAIPSFNASIYASGQIFANAKLTGYLVDLGI